MKFNIKVILLGGLAMYAAQWIVSMVTGIFDNILSALDGSSMIKGIKFGFILCLIYLGMSAGWSGVFNLPEMIWVWWSVDAFVVYLVGGAVLGLVVGKLSPE
jgi:hypothetical protein